ncbi:MAG: Ig-like domain-containing protein [Thermoanaerobaculia bacterium]
MNSPARRVALTSLVVLALVLGVAGPAEGQCVSLTTLASASNQDFNTLANTGTSSTVPTGWYFAESDDNANTLYTAGIGSGTAGDTYSFGAAGNSDRAFGGLLSGSLVPTIGACFTNNTGSTITSLDVAYTGEEWRLGTINRTDRIDFQYSSDATSLTTGTWTNVDALDFSTPMTTATGAKDGNAAANRTAISSTIASLSIANGATIWFRWMDFNASGADDGLAIDDFAITPQGVVADTPPSVVSTNPTAGATAVPVASDITVTFTEAVTVSAASFTLECPGGAPFAGGFAVSGSGTATITINPTGDLPAGTACDVGVIAASVTDLDGTADPMASGYAWTFTTASATPALSINDVTLAEGNSGTTTFQFTVSLSAPAGPGGVTFDIATADNTATVADSDYVANSLTGQSVPPSSGSYPFSVTVNGDTAVEPNETFFVNVSNVTGATVADGQGQGTITNDDVALTPIHDIQGSSLLSPLDGNSVTTRGIVTARKYNNGFFIQEPDATVDADPATSEGLFVYTGSAPTVAVGDLVQVAGTVDEYVQGGNFGAVTELVAPLTITVVSSGNPLPAATALTTTMPSPAGSWYQLEHLEGMRVSVPGFLVTAATDGNPGSNYTTGTSYGDCYGVVSGVARPLREDGIAYPNNPPAGTTIPPLLRFDSNPETIRVDTDGQVSATRINLSARTVLPAFDGVLDYAFSRYSILPDVGSLPAIPAEFVPTGVTAPLASEFTVAAYNLQRFFDDVNDPAISEPVLLPTQYEARLAKASLHVRDFLLMPDVVGVVEVENLSTLQTLATRISTDAVAASQPDPLYQAYLVEGNDVGGIDVGFLVKTSLVGADPRVQVLTVTQELDGTLFANPDSSTETLNDRPPLMLRAIVHGASGGTYPVTVLVNHLRSMNDVDSDAAGSYGWPTLGARVRAKRQAQAFDLANLVQTLQGENVIVVGDFNAFDVNDSLGDLMATIIGTPADDATTAVSGDGADLVNPDLVDLGAASPAAERYSYVYDFTAQKLDHALVNAALVSSSLVRRVEYARINADFPEIDRSTTTARLSDHDPLVVYVQAAALASAGVSITMTDAPDPVFPGAGLAYTITATNAGPDSATALVVTDTLPAGTTFSSLTSPAGWTCSTPAVGASGTVTCSAATLAAATNAAFTLNVTVDAGTAGGTVLSNTASIGADTGDPNLADNSATTTTTVLTPPAVFATKTVSGVYRPGGTATYTIVLTNNGSTVQADNPGDELTDVLPSSLVLVSASATSGTAVATLATNTVTWNGAIPAGGSVTVTIVATISSSVTVGQTVSNQATAAYDADGNGTNETSAPTDNPATGTAGDPTVFTVNRDASGAAVVPTLDTFGLGILSLLVALGGALVLGRRLS